MPIILCWFQCCMLWFNLSVNISKADQTPPPPSLFDKEKTEKGKKGVPTAETVPSWYQALFTSVCS